MIDFVELYTKIIERMRACTTLVELFNSKDGCEKELQEFKKAWQENPSKNCGYVWLQESYKYYYKEILYKNQ